eukprot:scaffold7044_cov216-Pinguiococcus_pyrenoidosus.AAC.4
MPARCPRVAGSLRSRRPFGSPCFVFGTFRQFKIQTRKYFSSRGGEPRSESFPASAEQFSTTMASLTVDDLIQVPPSSVLKFVRKVDGKDGVVKYRDVSKTQQTKIDETWSSFPDATVNLIVVMVNQRNVIAKFSEEYPEYQGMFVKLPKASVNSEPEAQAEAEARGEAKEPEEAPSMEAKVDQLLAMMMDIKAMLELATTPVEIKQDE